MPQLSSTLDRFGMSKISEIFTLATRLKEEGRDIINLSTGEPDFETPEHVKDAARRAIDAGETKYSPIDGTTTLKRAIQRKFRRDNALAYGLDEIAVSFGAKPLLFNALQALLDPGDEVVMPTPCWTSYPGMARLAGGVPHFVKTALGSGFKMSPAALDAAISPRTKCLIHCSPGNPTGAAYTEAELRALADVLLAHPDVWIISDDLYEHIVFDGLAFRTLVQVEPRLKSRTLTVNGVSKGYAMTGWRIGYAGGPKSWIAGIAKILSQSSGGCCSISEAAAVGALDGPQEFLREWAETYRRRRDRSVAAINGATGLRTATPEGAFYLFPECSGVFGRRNRSGALIENATDFVRHLVEEWGVAVVPGAAFEAEGYFRLSYATADRDLDEGLRRIAAACAALQ